MTFAVSFPLASLHRPKIITSLAARYPRFAGAEAPVADVVELSTRIRELPPLDETAIAQFKKYHQDAIRALVKEFDTRPLAKEYPPIGKLMAYLGLPDWQGIPPLMAKGASNCPDYKTTNGAMAIVSLEIVKRLPAASSAEEALGQIKEALDQVCSRGFSHLIGLRGKCGYQTNAITVAPVKVKDSQNRVYTSLQTGHILFVKPNGAMQVVMVPDALALRDMILQDNGASSSIEKDRPVKINSAKYLPPAHLEGFDLSGILQLLQEKSEGKHQDRVDKAWTDIHTLLKEVPFDYARHVRDGRLRVVFDKPGADGKGVWDAT